MPVGDASPVGVRVEHTVTSGTFSLDGGTTVCSPHGDATSVAAEAPHLAEGIDRGPSSPKNNFRCVNLTE